MLFQGHKVRILPYTARGTQTYLRQERPVEVLSKHAQKINLDIRSIWDFMNFNPEEKCLGFN